MKYLMQFFFITACPTLFAQVAATKVSFSGPTTTMFITGLEADTRAALSLKAGISRISWVDCDGSLCFKSLYEQAYAKYNFLENAIGAQATIGYSEGIGGRLGFDYEYSLNAKKSDFSIFLAGGLDFFGAFSIVIGPKFNLTQNASRKLATFHIGIDFPPSVFFESGKANKMLR